MIQLILIILILIQFLKAREAKSGKCYRETEYVIHQKRLPFFFLVFSFLFVWDVCIFFFWVRKVIVLQKQHLVGSEVYIGEHKAKEKSLTNLIEILRG